MKTGSFFTSPRHSKSGRTSNRSHVSSRDTGRRDVRPLTQIAEVLSAQDEAKQALQQVANESRELRECVKEFVSTEATYTEDLRKVVDVFVEPLRALLPPNLQYAIFSNLSQLHQLHVGLHADIVKGQEQVATDQGLACVQAFAKLLPYLKMCAPPMHSLSLWRPSILRRPAHASPARPTSH
jgi:NCAIR mutase (PurE)-related protein